MAPIFFSQFIRFLAAHVFGPSQRSYFEYHGNNGMMRVSRTCICSRDEFPNGACLVSSAPHRTAVFRLLTFSSTSHLNEITFGRTCLIKIFSTKIHKTAPTTTIRSLHGSIFVHLQWQCRISSYFHYPVKIKSHAVDRFVMHACVHALRLNKTCAILLFPMTAFRQFDSSRGPLSATSCAHTDRLKRKGPERGATGRTTTTVTHGDTKLVIVKRPWAIVYAHSLPMTCHLNVN